MTDAQIHMISHSVKDTQALGELMGEALSSPTCLFLTGDLGSGKTAFVQGLAKGLGVPEKCYITSPTYTLVNEYPGRIPIYHMDLYRLNSLEDIDDIGFYDMLEDSRHIVAVEWADRIPEDSFKDCISIFFNIIDDYSRSITITITGPVQERLIEILSQHMKHPL